jgi:4-hydroxymandelate oxidase
VRDAVDDALPLIVDGGIRRGTDVLKAIALGARAVLVGRPMLHALAADGAPGVARMLRLLRDELEAAMALTGCRTLADATPRCWPLAGGNTQKATPQGGLARGRCADQSSGVFLPPG